MVFYFMNGTQANLFKRSKLCRKMSSGAIVDGVLFYEWDSGEFIQKIEAVPKDVFWSDSGNMVLLATEESAYVLSYNAQQVAQAIAMGQVSAEAGIDGSFELLYE